MLDFILLLLEALSIKFCNTSSCWFVCDSSDLYPMWGRGWRYFNDTFSSLVGRYLVRFRFDRDSRLIWDRFNLGLLDSRRCSGFGISAIVGGYGVSMCRGYYL
jgi:hypothetical protein